MPRTFQNLIDKKMKDIPHLYGYLDDILITGKSRHEHLNALDAVMNRLEQVGFRLKQVKCIFLADSAEYVGLKLTSKAFIHLKKN